MPGGIVKTKEREPCHGRKIDELYTFVRYIGTRVMGQLSISIRGRRNERAALRRVLQDWQG
jgi:hypothetical protein